ncbi:SUKH-4 family immunity protein [Streptomyces sp. B-S-A8]|uniref:SUKH-4 family immunity protein n=1 Tax=Streptomyces solicavernae TaxID=3043614 RepID=A0ABT6S1E5_9ACTN|nr:SUKH-4 family immunity protein [Streptomyces sp. B-S-A8]MDI3390511.1 SUKH-4 family immunity protein [Streptomyces sp. B-S-A8]
MVRSFGFDSKSTGVKFVAEIDSDVYDLNLQGRNSVLLAPDPDVARPSLDALPPRRLTALTALALAEPYRVRFEEWQGLCAALGTAYDLAELRTISEESSLVAVDLQSFLPVGFAVESDARSLRKQLPAETFAAFQDAVVDRLFGCDDDDPLRGYADRALPAHSALAGRFEQLLEDAHTLVRHAHTVLFEAMPVAFPGGVPAGSFAADLHYLHELGVAPSSHAEWVSLLHLLTLSQGDEERARALAEAYGPLPWRTVWTHWRAPGHIRPVLPQILAVDTLRAQSEGATVTSRTVDGGEQIWHSPTGRLIGVAGQFNGAKGPYIEEASASTVPSSPRWQPDRPSWNLIRLSSTDDSSTHLVVQAPQVYAVACIGDLVVLGGNPGMYAIEPDPEYQQRTPALPALPAVGALTKITPRPCDEAACRPTRDRVLDVFDADMAPLLTEEQLPTGLTHEPTRRFLTEVGFPRVENFVSLNTHDLTETGFVEHTWEGTKKFETPVGDGPFYDLGTWIGGVLLLDGPTGRILRQSQEGAIDEDRPGDPLAGSSLAQFTAMVRLQWTYMLAWVTSGRLDGEDIIDELKSWLACIDPDAAATRNWGHVTDSDELG